MLNGAWRLMVNVCLSHCGTHNYADWVFTLINVFGDDCECVVFKVLYVYGGTHPKLFYNGLHE